MSAEFRHIPIMAGECLEHLAPAPGAVYVDGTLGGGGHARLVLEKLGPGGRLIGIDRDDAALAAAGERLEGFGPAFTPVKGNYKDIRAILERLDIEGIDGALLDLGVSSPQLDDPKRGFSYNNEARLDMRMDSTAVLDAHTVVNQYTQEELARIIFSYGEDRFARRIASFIVRARQRGDIDTTTQLAQIVTDAIPAKFRRTGPNPARRTFQALRIEVNGELEGLGEAIDGFIDCLNPGGRLCIISFHSLEDRTVKETMRRAQDPCTCPKDIPVCVCGKTSKGRMVPRKPIIPTQAEIEENPRARSAKLRVFHKI